MQIHGLAEGIQVLSNFRSVIEEKGSVFLAVAVLVPILILLLGFTIDIGRAFVYKEELNKACLVASGEAIKFIDIEAAQTEGNNRLSEGYAHVIEDFFYSNIADSNDICIKRLQHNITGGSGNPCFIEVICEADINCMFLKIVGIDNIRIHSDGKGRLRRIK